MKLQIKFFVFVFLILLPLLIEAQSVMLQKANDFYSALAYSEAIPKYEKALKGDIKKEEKFKIEGLLKLADCYRLTNNNKKTLETYVRVLNLKIDLDSMHRFYYAQSLMIAGKYEYAKAYLNTFKLDEKSKSETKNKIFAKSIEEIKMFYKHASNYRTKKVSFNSNKNDFCPSFWKDKIVFTSSRDAAYLTSHKSDWTGNNYDALYYTTRKANGKYSNVSKFKNIEQSKYNDGSTSFSSDGKFVYFTRNNIIDKKVIKSIDDKVNLKIFMAKDTNNKFENPIPLLFNSDNFNCVHPSINSDGTILYFSSDMPGGYGGMDIWACYIVNGFYSQPVNLGDKINTAGNEVFPYVYDNKVLYFSSNGLDGMGGLDIFKVFLDENGKPKGTVYNLGAPINSTFDDFGIVLYPGSDSGYFCSNFGNKNNDDDIYSFSLDKPILMEIDIKGVITDKNTKEIIPGAKVILKELNGKIVDKVITDENGKFTIIAEAGKDYIIEWQKDGYFDPPPKTISTVGKEGAPETTENLQLEKISNMKFIVSVVNVKDKKPLDNVKIEFLNNANNKKDSFFTAPNGVYALALTDKKSGDSLNYRITLSKEGFISKVIDWEYNISKIQDINLNTSIGKIEVGNSLQNLITLKPIYFDYNKYNIRPDAALELDKIVAIMNQYSNFSIDLSSHTDCRGDAKSNMILSEKRAESSVDYIVSKGIQRNRLTPKGYGESRLVNHCECEGKRIVPCTEEEHAMNRRTEFLIVRITEDANSQIKGVGVTNDTIKKTTTITINNPVKVNPNEINVIEYIVEQGETLYSISKKYNISIEQICEINNITKDYALKSGQRIKVPAK
ncbi:MAG: OmpA family protein [Bacteroidota bacterium]